MKKNVKENLGHNQECCKFVPLSMYFLFSQDKNKAEYIASPEQVSMLPKFVNYFYYKTSTFIL